MKGKKETPAKGTFTSGEIFAACTSNPRTGEPAPLAKLMQQKFPIVVSFKLVKLARAVQEELTVIEELRNNLIREYGVADADNPNQITVPTIIENPDENGKMIANPNYAKFSDEITELMAQEVKLVVEKVKLPEMVAATCDKCHHNMDRALEIEPNILLTLEKFIEV